MFTLSRLTTFIVEPLFWLMLCWVLSLLALSRWRKAALSALWSSLFVVFLLGFEALPKRLLSNLEQQFPIPTSAQIALHEGVIVLGGVVNIEMYQGSGRIALNEAAERLTEPVALSKRHPHLKLLHTGHDANAVQTFFEAQGIDMKRVQFEVQARNTRENAQLSVAMLGPEACQGQWLVLTSAWHMPRAMAEFDALGCKVTPYPVDFRTDHQIDWTRYTFDARNWVLWQVALHEYLGMLVYKLTR